MKILAFIFFLSFGFIASCNCMAQDTIHWGPNYQLKWEDFQGIPDSNSKYKAISNPAINYNLSFNEKGFSCKVFCFFKKKKSWVTIKDSILLRHEQGHFDIAELFARKFRKKIKEYKFSYLTISQDIEKIFKDIITERENFDSLYDKETDFSRYKQKQVYWNKRILGELKKIEEYRE